MNEDQDLRAPELRDAYSFPDFQMSAGSSDEQRTTAAICRAVYQVIGRVSLSG